MKFFSAILVAVVCATAVSAAPSTSPAFSFSDFADTRKCISTVVHKVFAESEIKGVWAEAKTKMDHLKVEFQKCMKMEGAQQHECTVAVMEKVAKVVGEFVKEVANESHMHLLTEITQKVIAECFHGAISEADKQKFREKVKCIMEGITEAVKDTDFAPAWEEYAKHLAELHEHIKTCSQKPNHADVTKCIFDELKRGEESRRKFFEHLKNVEKDDFVRVANHVKGKCFQ